MWVDGSGRKHKDGLLPSSAALGIVSAPERNLRYKNMKYKTDDRIDTCNAIHRTYFSKTFFYVIKVGSIYSQNYPNLKEFECLSQKLKKPEQAVSKSNYEKENLNLYMF